MTTTTESQCITCQNELPKGKCTAYPEDIPKEIWTGTRHDCQYYTSLDKP